MSVSVYIATTAGPIRVERIVGEDVPLSQVYQGRSYQPLEPVSTDYDRFVAPGGPVARAFGLTEAAAYRMELSGPVGSGNSWELGFLVAHGLAQIRRLAAPEEKPDRALLLTGRVDVGLGVGSVGHIPEKVASARPLIDECRDAGTPLSFVIPSCQMAGINAPGIDIIGVETAHSLLDGLGIPAAPTAPPPRLLTRSRRRLGFGMTMIAVVFFVGFLAVGGLDEITSLRQESSYVGSTPTLDTSAPPFSIAVGERRAPDGRTCADVQFGKVPPRLVPVSSAGDGRLASSRLAGLCGLRFSVVWPPSTLHGAAYLAVESGRYIEGVDTDRSVGAIVPIKPDSPWDVDLPWHLGNAFVYRIVIAAGAERVDAALDALRETADWDKAVASMAERGITVLTLSHRVDP